MREFAVSSDFDVEELSTRINAIMSKWSVQLIDINGPMWAIYDYDMDLKFLFAFDVDFNDIETRIKLEDLKLNIIHHVESLKDETTYRDNLISAVFL